MNRAHKTIFVTALLLAAQSPLRAQDTIAVGVQTPIPPGQELPAGVADGLVAFYNSASTIRFSGRTRVPAGRTITGDVAILGGPVELAGVVDGDLVVLNGDVTLTEGSRVNGDLTVVGGIVLGTEDGYVDGVITTYTAVFRYRRVGDGIEDLGSGGAPSYEPTSRSIRLPSWKLGESEIFISARAYNRVEALPIAIGPRITTGGSNPLRFDALLIWRTIGGFEPQKGDLGWQVRAKQWLFGHRAAWLEGGFQSVINPIEDWQLTNLENSLALFFFRRDYRDYYEREGWYASLGGESHSVFGSVEYRDERHSAVATRNVWTIFFNKTDELRPNAAADPGDLQSVIFTLGVDTRNDPDRPWSGWYGVANLERAVGGELSGEKPDFTHLLLDLRRYLRVSRSSALALRLVGGGRLGDRLLPAQRQHVIGGTGSLPGYSMMEFDCGVRSSGQLGEEPGYGCQRFTLFQAEYRTGLNFRWRWDETQDFDDIHGDIFSIDFDPAFVLFYNAGAAWDTDEDYWDYLTKSDNWLADLGAGLDFGGLGFYFAYPLVGSGGFNFVVRLTARF
jgi:hypothetical protein